MKDTTGRPRRTDVIVLMLCTTFLLACIGTVGRSGRERAKRAVCLSNLRQLTEAWRQFADDHRGNLVNGAAGIARSSGGVIQEPWVGRCWSSSYQAGGQAPESLQAMEIREGALWPYVQDLKVYRCPSGYPGEMLNYSVVDSMNGLSRTGTVTLLEEGRRQSDRRYGRVGPESQRDYLTRTG